MWHCADLPEFPPFRPAQSKRVRAARAVCLPEPDPGAAGCPGEPELSARLSKERGKPLRIRPGVSPVAHRRHDDVFERVVGRQGDVDRRGAGEQVQPDPLPDRATAAAHPGHGVRLGSLHQGRGVSWLHRADGQSTKALRNRGRGALGVGRWPRLSVSPSRHLHLHRHAVCPIVGQDLERRAMAGDQDVLLP
jgi:hypothetical protein